MQATLAGGSKLGQLWRYSRAVRVTRAATTPTCAICERTLLLGERAIRFAPDDGDEFVDVCPLCHDLALEHGWIKEGAPTTPTLPGDRRRRRGLFGDLLGFARARSEQPLAVPEPILRRLSQEELAVISAADLFNASDYCRTVGGIAKSLGEPNAGIVPLSGVFGELAVTIAWDISWYQYRVSPESAQPVRLERRGHELTELEERYRFWTAQVEEDGRLVPHIARV
jgi:hypothetical protein